MIPLILFFSIVVNVLQSAMHLLFWYILPATAVALILFTLARLLLHLRRWISSSSSKRPAS